ncbi:MAG: nitroreductase [Paracoccaceae bacterium]
MRITIPAFILPRAAIKDFAPMTLPPADLDALFAARHSCRAFRPDPVPRDVIEQIIATAQRVPSWCNAQPWGITVTSGAETDRFRAALMAEVTSGAPKPDMEKPDMDFPTAYTGPYQERRRTCGWQLYDAVGVEKGDRAGSARQMMQNFSLFSAPHCVILSSPADLGAYGAMDCGGFVTGFCLAAQAQGVASVAQAAVASYAPFLHRHFDIGDDRLILCAISFGYEDTEHPANKFRTTRAEQDAFVDWRG